MLKLDNTSEKNVNNNVNKQKQRILEKKVEKESSI